MRLCALAEIDALLIEPHQRGSGLASALVERPRRGPRALLCDLAAFVELRDLGDLLHDKAVGRCKLRAHRFMFAPRLEFVAASAFNFRARLVELLAQARCLRLLMSELLGGLAQRGFQPLGFGAQLFQFGDALMVRGGHAAEPLRRGLARLAFEFRNRLGLREMAPRLGELLQRLIGLIERGQQIVLQRRQSRRLGQNGVVMAANIRAVARHGEQALLKQGGSRGRARLLKQRRLWIFHLRLLNYGEKSVPKHSDGVISKTHLKSPSGAAKFPLRNQHSIDRAFPLVIRLFLVNIER